MIYNIHMFGDFNARTGNKKPENEQVFNIFEDEDDIHCKSISLHPKTKKLTTLVCTC